MYIICMYVNLTATLMMLMVIIMITIIRMKMFIKTKKVFLKLHFDLRKNFVPQR
jgi:hypothetical protein